MNRLDVNDCNAVVASTFGLGFAIAESLLGANVVVWL
jgi:hypothetical protein